MPVLSISRCNAPEPAWQGISTSRAFCLRISVLKPGTGQSSPAISSRLATMPVVWRKDSLNNAFSVRQVWIAASEKTGWRPRLPVGADNHCIPGSNRI